MMTTVAESNARHGEKQNLRLIKPSRPQSIIFASRARFKVLNAGRRFGKTFLALIMLFVFAVNNANAICWYVAPTYKQAEQIAWADLKNMVPEAYILRKDETDLSITLRNNSVIALRGSDNPDSLRGPGLDALVLDEAAFQKKEVWKVMRPMLADKKGWCLFISTPKGYNWFFDLYNSAENRKGWERFQYTTADGGNVDPEEIEDAKSELDEKTFNQEFLASFETLTGRIYYNFSRDLNKTDYEITNAPILVGMDFNVNPMTAAIAQRSGSQIIFVDEIVIPDGNTEMMAQEIRRRYLKNVIFVYPDPTGNRRQTNAPAGQTDFTILRSHGFTVLAPTKPYSIADKYNTVNAALCNKNGLRRVLVKRGTCPLLCKGWDGYCYKENTGIPDKSGGLDHETDAAAYLINYELPILGRGISQGTAIGI